MFCKNCSTVIKNGESICSNCGAVVEHNEGAASKDGMGLAKKTIIFAMILQVVQIILFFVKFANIGYSITGTSYMDKSSMSVKNFIFSYSTAPAVIYVLLFVAAIVLCLIPILTKSYGKWKLMIYPMIMQTLNLFCVVFSIISFASGVSQIERKITSSFGFSADYININCNITFGGVLTIIAALTGMIVLIVSLVTMKKSEKN